MAVCSIKGCKNTNTNCKNKSISFFSFPKSKEFKAKWVKHVENPKMLNIKTARVCSIHFKRSCYKPKPAYLWNTEGHAHCTVRKLLDNAVPTEYLNGETQPEMYGTKTEWIPSDGITKSYADKSIQFDELSARLSDDNRSSSSPKDNFVLYNNVPIQEVANNYIDNVNPLLIKEVCCVYEKETVPLEEMVTTTTLDTDKETVIVYNTSTKSKHSEISQSQSKQLRLQLNVIEQLNKKLDIKCKENKILKRKIKLLEETMETYFLKNGKLKRMET